MSICLRVLLFPCIFLPLLLMKTSLPLVSIHLDLSQLSCLHLYLHSLSRATRHFPFPLVWNNKVPPRPYFLNLEGLVCVLLKHAPRSHHMAWWTVGNESLGNMELISTMKRLRVLTQQFNFLSLTVLPGHDQFIPLYYCCFLIVCLL